MKLTTAPSHPVSRVLSSSTLLVSVLLPAVNLWLESRGIVVPWEVVLTGVGAYGAKEAASKLAGPKPGRE